MLFNARGHRLNMAAKTQTSRAFIRVNVVKMYSSVSLAIRFITANEIACGGRLAFDVGSGAYLIIIFFGNKAGNGHRVTV